MHRYQLGLSLLVIISIACSDNGGPSKTTCLSPITAYDDKDWIKHPSLCSSDTCVTYLQIWKDIFKEKSALTKEYFDNHITVLKTSTGNSVTSVSFQVCYKTTVNWADAYACDVFVILVKNGTNLQINLPLNTLLVKVDIEKVLNAYVFSSFISASPTIETLTVNSKQAAVNKLINSAKVSTLCFDNIRLNAITGHLILQAKGQYVNAGNSCVFAEIDLMDGQVTSGNTPCDYSAF